jgi:hypothetical protein
VEHVATGAAHSAAAGVEPLLISMAMMAVGSVLAFNLFGFVTRFGASPSKRAIFSEKWNLDIYHLVGGIFLCVGIGLFILVGIAELVWLIR